MKSFPLRGLDEELDATLKKVSKKTSLSINQLILNILREKLGTKEEQNKNEFYEFLDSPRLSVIEIGEMTAEHYSNIFLQLKKSGKPIPTNDIWIAASAMENGMPLATFDKHFSNIQGLLLVPGLY